MKAHTTFQPVSVACSPVGPTPATFARRAEVGVPRVVWIDLDNSPHVPFFHAIVDELHHHGLNVLLTARDAYQVTSLVRLHKLKCEVIGRHYGANKGMKVAGMLLRTLQLRAFAVRHHPALVVNHGSRSQTLAARLLGIPSVVIADYEHVAHVNRSDVTIVPAIIPRETAARHARRVLTYPGIKEDVYAAAFVPDAAILQQLQVDPTDLVVTVRPPATEAHYHNPESEALLDAVIRMLAETADARVVLLPRNGRQAAQCRARWPALLASGRMSIPDEAVDGLNLVWHSDLVVSGGGTMNREAAALGVPVYSIFRGQIGAVDHYLAEQGRLTLIETTEQVRDRIKLVKRAHSSRPARTDSAALAAIVGHLLELAGVA
jgi:predicted glycosyltransferase